MRMHGHGAHDDMSYVPEEMLEEWARRDPIDRYGERLVAEHGFDPTRSSGPRRGHGYVDECAQKALDSPMPDPAGRPRGRLRRRRRPARRRPGALVDLPKELEPRGT